MSSERLRAEIQFVLHNCRDDWAVGAAFLNDLMRGLHEVYLKSGYDQTELLGQVNLVFGLSTAHHLARVLNVTGTRIGRHQTHSPCPVYDRLMNACAAHFVQPNDGNQLFCHFIQSLDLERVAADGSSESPLFMLYFTLGDEAAYHLGALYSGDDLQSSITELEYLDPEVKRFKTMVDRWELELKADSQ